MVQEQLEVWVAGNAWERLVALSDAHVAAHEGSEQYEWKLDKDELHERDS